MPPVNKSGSLHTPLMWHGVQLSLFLTSSFSALNRVLEPSVLMELKLSDGKIHTFEVSEIVIVLLARFICSAFNKHSWSTKNCGYFTVRSWVPFTLNRKFFFKQSVTALKPATYFEFYLKAPTSTYM